MDKEKAPQAGGPDVGAVATGNDTTNDDSLLLERLRRESAKSVLSDGELAKLVHSIEDFDKAADEGRGWQEALEELQAGNERLRAWWFILYPESCNPDWLTLLVSRGLRGAISPLHDADCWENGEPKKPHWHVLLVFEGKKSFAQIQRIVRACGGVRLEPVDNLTGAVRYLLHLDIRPDKVAGDKGKVKYDAADLVCIGGFDAAPHLKATQSQKAEALEYMYKFIDDERIEYLDVFIRRAYGEHPDWSFLLSQQSVVWLVKSYIDAIRARERDRSFGSRLARLEGMMEVITDGIDC